MLESDGSQSEESKEVIPIFEISFEISFLLAFIKGVIVINNDN